MIFFGEFALRTARSAGTKHWQTFFPRGVEVRIAKLFSLWSGSKVCVSRSS